MSLRVVLVALWWLLLVLALAFIGALGWVLATPAGAAWLAGEATARVEGLELDGVDGDLIDGLRIARLALRAGDVHVAATGVEVQVDALGWLLDEGPVQIALVAATLDVESGATAEDDGEPVAIPAPPLDFAFERFAVGRATVLGQALDEVELAGEWTSAQIAVEGRLVVAETALEGRLATPVGTPLEVDARVAWRRVDGSGALEARGPLEHLEVVHRLEEPRTLESRGTIDVAALPRVAGELEHVLADPAATARHTFVFADGVFALEGSAQYEAYTAEVVLTATPERVDVARFVATDGPNPANRVSASGHFEVEAQRIAAEGTFELADHALYADYVGGIDGVASGEFRLAGDWQRPDGSVQLRSSALAVAGVAAANLDARAAHENGRYRIEATAGALDVGGQTLTAPAVELDGTLSDALYTVRWKGGHARGRLSFVDETLKASIESGAELELAGSTWTNTAAVKARYADGAVNVSAHCWRGAAELCIDAARWSGERGELTGHLVDFDLTGLAIAGLASGTAAGEWRFSYDGNWRGTAVLAARGLAVQGVEGDTLPLPDVEAGVRADANGFRATLGARGARLEIGGELTGRALELETPIDGRLTVAGDDFSMLALLDLPPETVTGRYRGDVRVGGTLRVPEFEAEVGLAAGAIRLQSPHFVVDGLEANGRAESSSSSTAWSFEAGGRYEGTGRIALTAEGDGYTAAARASGRLEGEGVELKAPDWTIEIAPDLALEYTSGAVRVSGTIDVPRARIELDSVPASLPKPSSDVTVVGRTTESQAASATTTSGQVRIRLGKDVRYRGFGLDVALEGELEADIENMEVVQLRGELRTRDGRLEAQGQTLAVESGRVVYSGPVDNPYLDLVATREITDYTEPLRVGLRVRGPADKLETSVFSYPAMSQTRALSFLVLGRDFDETEGDDSSLLVGAAIGLGLKGALPIVDQVRTGLKLDELTAASAGGEEVEIIAGKRVTKDIYVRYTYNALASVSAFVIRYSLNERWRLEATSSDAASMDLLYKIER